MSSLFVRANLIILHLALINFESIHIYCILIANVVCCKYNLQYKL